MDMNVGLVILGFLASVVLILVVKTLYTVRTYTAGVVERFGKFARIVQPGLHTLVPFAERVFFVDLQVKQAQFSVETKTKDNVFVQIPVSVQYQILSDKIYDAFYKLRSPQKQIESFVFNSILGHVPKLSLDETFEQQSGISVAVKTELDSIMSGFGFNILTALVTDIIPDSKVKDAMNDINAAQRAQVAAQARGEAEKILKVKQAEAEAESKALQGKGIAAERQAIIDGLRASIENFRESVPGATASDVMALVLLTQYFDTLKDIGTKSGNNTVFLPNSPGAANDFMTQILAGLKGSMNAGSGAGGMGLPVVNPAPPPPVAKRLTQKVWVPHPSRIVRRVGREPRHSGRVPRAQHLASEMWDYFSANSLLSNGSIVSAHIW